MKIDLVIIPDGNDPKEYKEISWVILTARQSCTRKGREALTRFHAVARVRSLYTNYQAAVPLSLAQELGLSGSGGGVAGEVKCESD